MKTGTRLNSLRKYFSSSWFLVIIALIVVTVGTIGIVYAAQPQNNGEGTVYRIAVDNRGNLRLLQSDINGNFSEEPKENEFTIELPSSQLVSGSFNALQAMLGGLEGTVAEQDERITGLQGIIAGLDERISALEALFDNFTINATAGAGGSILPFGVVMVDYGEDQTFTITPDEGYYILDVVVDGSSIGALNTYTFFAVAADHTIEVSFAADSPVPENIVLLLPMDEGEGPTVYDKSGRGNDGTISGASREQLPSGQWYLSFDGNDDYVDCGNDESLQGLSSFTVKAWVYMTSFTPSESYNVIFGKGGSDIVSGFMLGILPDGTIRLYLNDSGQVVLKTVDTLTTSEWHQVVAQADGTIAEIFIDGASSISGTKAYAADTTTNLIIGDRDDGYGSLGGRLALLEIYNRVLSDSEVQNSFNQEKNLFGVQ